MMGQYTNKHAINLQQSRSYEACETRSKFKQHLIEVRKTLMIWIRNSDTTQSWTYLISLKFSLFKYGSRCDLRSITHVIEEVIITLTRRKLQAAYAHVIQVTFI